MTTRIKIYIGVCIAALAVVLALIAASVWSDHKVAKLETAVATAKAEADQSSRIANQKEIEAAAFEQKIIYLEAQLTEIQEIARKQDDELQILTSSSGRARSDVDRARRTRAIAVSAAELCQKLAELGHGCE